MGGPATFEGATYQEGVIAYIFVHALAMRRLGWIEGADDTPIAVSGETGGPGDDVRVESAALTFELQAKAGLTGEAALTTTIREIVARMTAVGPRPYGGCRHRPGRVRRPARGMG